MTNTDIVRTRIERHLKKDAAAFLAEIGLSVSNAIRMLLVRVATDKALPFDINRTPPRADRKMR